ncbi:MAG: family 10 glycosylhydrolase [Fimbriimonadaceae bacterium]|jgi:uncharacterized lipoprotein YddW (UPF0748 family)|nr:family 10 glycosylhydrolase [Fimbriimonadaceae bacterium]
MMLSSFVAAALIGETMAPKFTLNREFRGVWVATVANIDWPSRPGLPVADQRSEMEAILDRCKDLNVNAVIFQIRPSADALYNSKLEPWSFYLTGEQGVPPAESFDPLEFTIKEAHERGIELHVWFNPYRALHPNQVSKNGAVHESHISRTHPDLVKRYGTFLWMDPGEQFIQDRSFAVFMDVVQRYDIDAIHIDDYFYPYPVTENGQKTPFPDQKSFAHYRANGGRLGLDAWRRKNVDDFIFRVHQGVKQRKPWVRFGISPFGIYRPGIPEGIRAGVDQYAELYADALKWYQKGWADYFSPQLYWPIAQTPQSYPVLLNWWRSQNAVNRHLWVGNFTSRTNPAEGNWKSQEVLDQIELTRKGAVDTGNIHFSMKALMTNWNGIADALKTGPYAERAIAPATTWLDKKAPKPPTLGENNLTEQGWRVEVVPDKGEPVRFFAVSALIDGKWRILDVSSQPTFLLPSGENAPKEVAVVSLDRVGNNSSPLVIRRPSQSGRIRGLGQGL